MVERNLSNHFLRRVLHNRRKKYLSRQVFLCECKKITIAIVWKKTIHKHKPKTCKNSLRQHFFKSYNTLKARRKMRFGERSSLNVFYSWEYLCGVESCIKIRLFNFNIVIKNNKKKSRERRPFLSFVWLNLVKFWKKNCQKSSKKMLTW